MHVVVSLPVLRIPDTRLVTKASTPLLKLHKQLRFNTLLPLFFLISSFLQPIQLSCIRLVSTASLDPSMRACPHYKSSASQKAIQKVGGEYGVKVGVSRCVNKGLVPACYDTRYSKFSLFTTEIS